jgi:hypothetical protein
MLHLSELHDEIKRFLDTKPYITAREPDPDREGGYRFRLSVKAAVPDSIGLIFGDFVHNLRASLDNLVWEFAVHRSRKLYFPINRDRPKSPTAFAPLIRASIAPEAFEIIERMQPYQAKDPSDPRLRLAVLNSWWNKDKHRTTTPVVAASHGGSVWATGDDPPPQFILNPGDVTDGQIIGWMPPGQPNMEREPHFDVQLWFHRKPLVSESTLDLYYRFVREDVIGAFEAL